MNKLQITNYRSVFGKRGFTVLESIVAIAVLSLTISGVFASVQRGLSQAIVAKDEVKAYYLAQEAVEVIRNKRDGNQLAKIDGSAVNWLDGVTQGAGSCPFYTVANQNTCTVDANNFQISHCGSGGWGSCAQNLKQDPVTFLYGYAVGNGTNFKREIQIESINANEIAVTVRVYWTKGIITKEFKAKTYLFNWI